MLLIFLQGYAKGKIVWCISSRTVPSDTTDAKRLSTVLQGDAFFSISFILLLNSFLFVEKSVCSGGEGVFWGNLRRRASILDSRFVSAVDRFALKLYRRVFIYL
jgi:hypothetical protein